VLERAQLIGFSRDAQIRHADFPACPSQVSVVQNSSKRSSSVNPDMYMKRFLKVGDASSKIV